jgi:hypothetical protein
MSDRVVHVEIDQSRTIVVTARGRVFQSKQTGERSAIGAISMNWTPVELPPGCESGVEHEDHSAKLGEIARLCKDCGPGSMPAGLVNQVWELVHPFIDSE